MKTEDKELLLKDLCARLPYGVKMQKFNEQNVFVNLYAINLNNYTIDFYTYKGKSLTIANTSKLARYGILLYKPCLFPLSSMTEEQKEELNRATNGKFNSYNTYIDNCKPRNWSEWGTTEYNWIKHHDLDLLHTWLNENHFDYRGLIPKGLAIDCTNLNIY